MQSTQHPDRPAAAARGEVPTLLGDAGAFASPDIVRGVSPPDFCGWRELAATAGVALMTGLLFGLGRGAVSDGQDWFWLLAYSAALGLFCALLLCVCRAWLRRLSTRSAWLLAWLLVLFATLGFASLTGVVAGALGVGPGPHEFSDFLLRSVAASAIVSAMLLRYLFVRAQWQAEARTEAEARVQALEARIRPHFLFNSLNTIAALIPDNPGAAERAIEDLADLFRASMRRADQFIPLSEELQLGSKYLDMERRRLGERLRVDWEIALLPEAAEVLPMLLQPLLENAVSHGIAPRADGGQLRVFARTEHEHFVLTVCNPLPERPSASGHGMALANIRARLDLAYGDAASLVTRSDGDRYFTVLTVPLRRSS